jgi:hypothetical protein
LVALLGKYVEAGVYELGSLGLLQVPPLMGMGTAMEILERFGGERRVLAGGAGAGVAALRRGVT